MTTLLQLSTEGSVIAAASAAAAAAAAAVLLCYLLNLPGPVFLKNIILTMLPALTLTAR